MTAPFMPPPLMFDNTTDTFYDQDGREFESAVVTLNRQPGERSVLTHDRTGYISPVGFTPPWLLPHEYIVTLPKEKGRNRILMDYDRYIADTHQAYREWENAVRKQMMKAFGPEYHANMAPTPAVLAEVGPPPRAWQPADAARKGNRWILYGEGTMPVKLAEFFTVATPTLDADVSWDDEPVGAVAQAEDIEDEEDRAAARRAKDAERKRAARAKASEEEE